MHFARRGEQPGRSNQRECIKPRNRRFRAQGVPAARARVKHCKLGGNTDADTLTLGSPFAGISRAGRSARARGRITSKFVGTAQILPCPERQPCVPLDSGELGRKRYPCQPLPTPPGRRLFPARCLSVISSIRRPPPCSRSEQRPCCHFRNWAQCNRRTAGRQSRCGRSCGRWSTSMAAPQLYTMRLALAPVRLNVSLSGTSRRWKTTVSLSPDRALLAAVISMGAAVALPCGANTGPSICVSGDLSGSAFVVSAAASDTVRPAGTAYAPAWHHQELATWLYGGWHSMWSDAA